MINLLDTISNHVTSPIPIRLAQFDSLKIRFYNGKRKYGHIIRLMLYTLQWY